MSPKVGLDVNQLVAPWPPGPDSALVAVLSADADGVGDGASVFIGDRIGECCLPAAGLDSLERPSSSSLDWLPTLSLLEEEATPSPAVVCRLTTLRTPLLSEDSTMERCPMQKPPTKQKTRRQIATTRNAASPCVLPKKVSLLDDFSVVGAKVGSSVGADTVVGDEMLDTDVE
jgi:hypothetical protein